MSAPNIILDELPDAVEVSGKHYAINTDFRSSIDFAIVLHDNNIDPLERIVRGLDIYYTAEMPDDKGKAYAACIGFYRCGEEIEEAEEEGEAQKRKAPEIKRPPRKRVLDYEQDARYIFAAFMGQYRMDLSEIDYLHWWKFKAMMDGLNDSQMIVKIMGYRGADLGKIKNKQEKDRIRRLQLIFSIKEDYTPEQMAVIAGNAFAGGLNADYRPNVGNKKRITPETGD